MSVIPALGKLRQEDHLEFKASLDYLVNAGTAWATEWNPCHRTINQIKGAKSWFNS